MSAPCRRSSPIYTLSYHLKPVALNTLPSSQFPAVGFLGTCPSLYSFPLYRSIEDRHRKRMGRNRYEKRKRKTVKKEGMKDTALLSASGLYLISLFPSSLSHLTPNHRQGGVCMEEESDRRSGLNPFYLYLLFPLSSPLPMPCPFSSPTYTSQDRNGIGEKRKESQY